MVICSRKHENYSYLKIAKTMPIAQIKLIQLYGKVMDCVISGWISKMCERIKVLESVT